MPHLPASDFLDGTLQLLGLPEALESIAGHAATASGRRAVREASPGMGEAERVERRQRGEELLVIQETVPLPEAAACPDLLHIVSKATQHALDGVELAGIQKCLNRFQEWAHWALHRGSAEHLSELLQGASDLSSLQELLRLTVDLRGEVLDTADPSLGPLRLEIRTLDQKRRKHIEQTAAEWGAKGHLENPRPVMRGGRPTLAVKAAHSGRTPGILHDRSNRGDTVYVEPSGVVELSNRLTKKTSAEKALVQRILSECTRTVVRRRADLEELDQIMGEADLGFASARWASEVQARFPTMTSEALVLREARHPGLIQSLGHAAVVPLDLELGKEFHLLVVTGPNTGGKTVVLKTVGLLASCACAGFPIPAAEGTNI
ncbi:MAG: hypothetical protein MK213_02405, partial [Planctomycetes bacterium]|nr:hypothetical protein [Planctomycetota bacterium]